MSQLLIIGAKTPLFSGFELRHIHFPLPSSTMKAVAVSSAYPAYSLKTADLTIAKLSDLTIYNIRRLFAAGHVSYQETLSRLNLMYFFNVEQGSDLMDFCKQASDENHKNRKSRIANVTIDRFPPDR